MTRLLLIRHGCTELNGRGCFQGWIDVSLNDDGRRQANLLGRTLAQESLSAVYSSPLVRAMDTAKAIAVPHGLEAVAGPGLMEISFGLWEGLTFEEALQRFPDEAGNQLKAQVPPLLVPDGEEPDAFMNRVSKILSSIVKRHPEESVAVVSHGGPIRLIIGICLGLPWELFWKLQADSASISELLVYEDTSILKRLNDTCHCRGEEAV
ncbi:MAG: histidine phosphatase family protein [bacterium]|nr:histidine phosphatase family protein [bacterium]